MAIETIYPADYPKDTPVKDRFHVLDNRIKDLKRWVCLQNGECINPHDGTAAYNDQKETWGTFDEACDYIEKHQDCVLGFQLGKDFDFTAISIGGFINASGEVVMDDTLKEIFDVWNESTYAEFDPYGNGITFLFSNAKNDPPRNGIGITLTSDFVVKVSVCDECIPISGRYCICKRESDRKETASPETLAITDDRELLNLIYDRILQEDPLYYKTDPTIEIDSALDDVEGLENEKWALSYLLKKNCYFEHLWNRIYPTSNGRIVDETEIIARILLHVTDNEPIAAKLFRASPYFRAIPRVEKRAYEDTSTWPENIRTINDLKKYNLIHSDGHAVLDDFASSIMRDRLDKATKLKNQTNFALFDNDIKLFLDPIYDTFIDLETDITYAKILIDMYGEQMKYCTEDDCWYVYTKGRWMYENNRDLKNIRRIGATVAKRLSVIPDWYDIKTDEKEKKRINKLKDASRKFANVSSFKSILEAARAVNPVEPDVFNKETHKIKVGNGTINLRTGLLLDDNSKDLFNTYTDTKYKPTTKKPTRFLKFLNDIFEEDKELIDYLQRVLGYCITGETKEQKFFVFHGTGANGKTTLINLLQDVLEEYVGNFDAYALALKEIGSGKPNPTILQNRYTRIVIVTETNKNEELDISLIKAISGGDKISTRMLYENNAKPFRPKYKMIFTTNHLPNIDWSDYGIKRRFIIIPFKHQFKDPEKDLNIEKTILNTERELILNWLIEGARIYYRFGLGKEPESVKNEIIKAGKTGNPFKRFTDEAIDVTKNEKDTIPVAELYNKYVAWCDKNDLDALKQRVFNRKVADILGVSKDIKSDDPKRCYHFFGIKYKS